jgi:hypothetical protein
MPNRPGAPHGLLLLLMVLAAYNACGSQPVEPDEKTAVVMPDNKIEQLIARYGESLMTLPDVVGISESLCEGKPCIKVLLSAENAETLAHLPKQLEGITVVAEVSGPFFASPQ